MLNYDLHKKLHDFNKKLNHVYEDTPALYEIEDSWQAFRWISVDEKDNNVLSFERLDSQGNLIAFIVNFSGNDYYKYRLGLDKGEYKIILNTDDKKYGGRGLLKRKTFNTVKKQAHGKDNSIMFDLPRFTGIYFVKSK